MLCSHVGGCGNPIILTDARTRRWILRDISEAYLHSHKRGVLSLTWNQTKPKEEPCGRDRSTFWISVWMCNRRRRERGIVSTEKVNWICAGATGNRDQARFNIEKANFGRTEKKEKGCTLFLISSEGLHPMGCYIDYFF